LKDIANDTKGDRPMSTSINTVTLTGYLGNDPVVEESKGVHYAQFSMATSLTYKDDRGNRVERTDWHRIVAFGALAKTLARLGKGDRVAVHGRLQSSTYTADGGEKRTSVEVHAAQVEFLRVKDRDEAAPTEEDGE
jgi:single-strand DNA-binding protein